MERDCHMSQTQTLVSEHQRTVLITGASRGIGEAIALGLLADGHKVIATARSLSNMENLRVQAEKVKGSSKRLILLALDVCDQSSIEKSVGAAEAQWGVIDVVINNAGVAASSPLHRTSDELWSHMIDVNLTGSFRVTRRVLGPMRKADYGRVIFISSIAGLTGCLYTSAYCAAKHGVIGMMRALALEVSRTSVTANAICPGFVETDMVRNAIAQIQSTTDRDEHSARGALEAFSPQQRLFQPDEILHTVRFLMGDGARGINGQAITVDGGQVMH
jgi:NAD(P)-dependent dehydrogenase (short-subunit alcohol dehydrogenase family)